MHALMARVHAYTWLVAHEHVTEAQRHLQRGVALAVGKPFNFGVVLAAEQAFAMAWFDGDAAGAQALVTAHEKVWPLLPESERWRTEAAMAIVRGDVEMARSHITQARRMLTAAGGKVGANAGANAGAKPSGTTQWALHRLADMEQPLSAPTSPDGPVLIDSR